MFDPINQQEAAHLKYYIMTDLSDLQQSLSNIAEAFKAGVDVRDRQYHLKNYKGCFVGSAAVDFLVDSGHAETREDAVMLGRALADQFFLFEHVTRDHEFKGKSDRRCESRSSCSYNCIHTFKIFRHAYLHTQY